MTTLDDVLTAADTVSYIAQEVAHLPVLGWRNGNKQAKTAGFWYVKTDGVPEPTTDNWQESSVYDNETGYVATTARLLPLMKRQQAFLESEDGYKTWLSEWRQGARIQTQILCLVEGFGNEPIIVSLKGLAGKAFTMKGGILDQHSRFVKAVNAETKRTFNQWAFWMPVSTLVDLTGKTMYQDTGFKSFTTPPMFVGYDPNNLKATILDRFVGKDVYEIATALYQQYHAEGWHTAKRGNHEPDPTTYAPVATTADADSDDDDDMPF